MNLTNKILLSLILGLIVGLTLNTLGLTENSFVDAYFINGAFMIVGQLFLNALKMIVVPLVFFALIPGIVGIGDIQLLGKIGTKTFILYLITTALAVTTALVLSALSGVGKGMDAPQHYGNFTGKETQPFNEILTDIVPDNIIAAMANGDILSIIFFSIFTGIALLSVSKKAAKLINIIDEINLVIMKMVAIIISFSPIAVFCLMAKVIAELGIELIGQLIAYCLVLISALILHALINLMVIFKLFSGLQITPLLKKIRAAQLFAFSTSSTAATIPITLKVCQEKLGIDKSTASFTVPFGATINMDGTAIMQGVATVFIANLYGIELSLSNYITIISMSVLASIGTASVPSVGLVMLTLVFNQVGLPLEGIALILGVDRLMDMLRTVVNVTGDIVVTTIISKSENLIDIDTYNDPNAGVINTK